MQGSLFDTTDEVIVPNFQEIGLDIDADFTCPKCAYEWSGAPGAVEGSDSGGVITASYDFTCPKCKHAWTGSPKPKESARHIAFGEKTQNGAAVVQRADKPPYRIPLMSEIRQFKPNGYMVCSTFSGCGGSSLGYKLAGYRVAWASEFIPSAQETYRANHLGTILDTRDIREVKAEDILAATGLAVGELDILDGSPPCASFSTAGKREKGWGTVKKYSDSKQRTDDLFYEFIRLMKGLQPKTFVAENVSGLIKGTAKGYFLHIMKELQDAGYRVRVKILDASWLGVPQARLRTIFVGVRSDLHIDPTHPQPLPYQYTVRDALPWIDRVIHDTSGDRSTGDVTDRPSPTVTVGGIMSNACHFQAYGPEYKPEGEELKECDITRFAIGAEWDNVAVGGQSEKYFSLMKPDPDRPCGTITQTAGNVGAAGIVHPYEKRKFTIAELRRICGFPDDFILAGTYAQQWERLGRAVPPPMMAAVARTIQTEILDRLAPSGTATVAALPVLPTPLPYQYTVSDALPAIEAITGRTGPQFTRVETEIDKPMNSILVTDPAQTRYEVTGAPLESPLDPPTPVAGQEESAPEPEAVAPEAPPVEIAPEPAPARSAPSFTFKTGPALPVASTADRKPVYISQFFKRKV